MKPTPRCLAAVVIFCAVASQAFAQPADWAARLRAGQPLFLTLGTGEHVDGVVDLVTAGSVTVRTDKGPRLVSFSDVARAERRDRLWNGAIIGAAVGVVLGSLGPKQVHCPSGIACNNGAPSNPLWTALPVALLGMGIDSMVKGRTTIFASAPSARIEFVPRRNGISAKLSLSW